MATKSSHNIILEENELEIESNSETPKYSIWQIAFINAYIVIEVYKEKPPFIIPKVLLFLVNDYWEQLSPDQMLFEGCYTGNIEAVRHALKRDANPGLYHRLHVWCSDVTPLYLSIYKGHTKITKLLIEHNSDMINEVNNFDNSTCLHAAASSNQIEICQLLISYGSDVNKPDKLGHTALMNAAEIGSEEIIKILLENNADVNIENRDRYSALSYCLDKHMTKNDSKCFNSAVCLINHGANPNHAGQYSNRTLLHYAATQGNLELVKELIEDKGAYINALDGDDKTPLDYAIEYGRYDVVKYLKLHHIDDNCKCSCIMM